MPDPDAQPATSTTPTSTTTATAAATATHTNTPTVPIKVTFAGGLAPSFNNEDTHRLALPAPATVGALVQHLTATFLRGGPASRLATFVLADGDAAPRPGILVLVNDVDWELEGGAGCVLSAGDEVLFVSTLHGG